MTDLSILIPSRNEMFLSRTIQDILEHAETDIEVIVVLDGVWANPPLEQHPKVTIVYSPDVIGQRAATNIAAKIASSKYLMKVDAHCSFDQGFDAKLLSTMQDDWTVVPIMKNLHAFDWVCKNGHRRYQSPSGECKVCGELTEMDIVWRAKPSPNSTSYLFDSEPHFQYFGEFKKRPEYEQSKPYTETMSLQGSCFMLTKERYFALNMNDETWGSWGSQGLEIAIKTWLSGGKCICNHNTWYAHMFRTQGGDFGFPYRLSGKQVAFAKQKARETFYHGTWEHGIRPLSWLIDKFWPVRGWTQEEVDKLKADERQTNPSVGIIYYTDNRLDTGIASFVQNQLTKSGKQHKIVSVSLEQIEFGENIVLDLERGYLTMFKQILAGLEAIDTDIVFFAEHDVLYHPSHFEFIPPEPDKYYYNTNVWKLRLDDGHCLHYACKQTSGLCAYRDLLLQHYRERVRRVESEGYSRNMGFEPGTHGRKERVDMYKSDAWQSEYPNVDIRHKQNLTRSRWRKDQFRNQRYTDGWTESDAIPGWGSGKDLVRRIRDG